MLFKCLTPEPQRSAKFQHQVFYPGRYLDMDWKPVANISDDVASQQFWAEADWRDCISE